MYGTLVIPVLENTDAWKYTEQVHCVQDLGIQCVHVDLRETTVTRP